MWNVFAIVLLACHLLAMNVAAAGPLVAAWLVSRGADNLAAARRMARWSLAALGCGAVLGLPLLLAPTDALRSAVARFPASTYWFAAAELAFSAACLALLATMLARGGRSRALAWGLALASATNLLYHFPPLMAAIGKLTGDPRWAAESVIEHRTLMRLAVRPEILALWMHFVLASIAVAAIAAIWPMRTRDMAGPTNATPHDADPATLRGLAAIALAASLAQLPVGVWVLVSSSARTRDALMGDDLAASVCFLGGVVAAIALLHSLAIVAMGEATAAMRRRTAWLLVVVAVLMSATLSLGRSAAATTARTASLTTALLSSPAPCSPLLACRRGTCSF